MRKLSRNAPCPCGSGRKYKRCCINQDFQFVYDENNEVCKWVKTTDEGEAHLMDFLTAPRNGAPASEEWIQVSMPVSLAQIGIHPAIIYAHMQTGLMLSDGNVNKATAADLEQWDAAIREWENATGEAATKTRLNWRDIERIAANGESSIP